MLAGFYNTPDDEQSLKWFSFINQDSHQRIVDQIYTNTGDNLQVYPMDPIPLFDISAWAYNHQNMHNDMNAVLGFAGNDLTDVDFSRPDLIRNWIWLHAIEHVQAENALGIG